MSEDLPKGQEGRLARIETKLDIVLSEWKDHEDRLRRLEADDQVQRDLRELEDSLHKSFDEKNKELGSRLTALERWKYGMPANLFMSIAAILVAIIPFLF